MRSGSRLGRSGGVQVGYRPRLLNTWRHAAELRNRSGKIQRAVPGALVEPDGPVVQVDTKQLFGSIWPVWSGTLENTRQVPPPDPMSKY